MGLVEVTATSSGLTTASTAYASGDMLGTQWSFTSALATAGGYGYVEGVVLEDDTDVIGATDLFLFNDSVTQAADNAAHSWSDADSQKCVGIVSMPSPYDTALNRISQWQGAIPFRLAGGVTTLYGGLVTRSAHTFFGATSSLHIRLLVNQQ